MWNLFVIVPLYLLFGDEACMRTRLRAKRKQVDSVQLPSMNQELWSDTLDLSLGQLTETSTAKSLPLVKDQKDLHLFCNFGMPCTWKKKKKKKKPWKVFLWRPRFSGYRLKCGDTKLSWRLSYCLVQVLVHWVSAPVRCQCTVYYVEENNKCLSAVLNCKQNLAYFSSGRLYLMRCSSRSWPRFLGRVQACIFSQIDCQWFSHCYCYLR